MRLQEIQELIYLKQLKYQNLASHSPSSKIIALPATGHFNFNFRTHKGTHDSSTAQICSIGLDPLGSLDEVLAIYHKDEQKLIEDIFTLTTDSKNKSIQHEYANGNIVKCDYWYNRNPEDYESSKSSIDSIDGRVTVLKYGTTG